MQEKVQYFHADYRDGRVHIGGKAYQAGVFATHLLNQYYKNDTAARLAVYKRYNWHTAETLSAGYLDADDFVKAGEEILMILQTLSKLQPFTMLDTENERNSVAELFSRENGEKINVYYYRKAAVHNMNENESALDLLPKEYDKDFFNDTEQLLIKVLNALRFYDSISEDMRKAFETLKCFVSRTDEASRLDEEHLLPIALEVFGKTDFSVRAEYVGIMKSSRSKTATAARRLYFESYYSFIITDFFEGLHYGHYPRQCEVCKKYFHMTSARRQRYCTGISPHLLRGKKTTCRKYAAAMNRKELAENDPITNLYNRRCSAIRVERGRGTITEEFAETAKELAAAHKQRAFEEDAYAQRYYTLDMAREKLYADTDRLLRQK